MKTTAKMIMIMGVIAGALVMTVGMVDFALAQSAGCPRGYTPSFQNNRLSCTRTQTNYADVVCLPPYTELVERDREDRCKIPLAPIPTSVNDRVFPRPSCAALGSGWTVEQNVNGSRRDRCRKVVTERVCPVCN
jgi:hypothetical protein